MGNMLSHDMLLGRWRLSLELFGRIFVDDVGAEPGSVITDLGGFPVKEMRFRREMEKLRSSQQRDLTLTKVRFSFDFYRTLGIIKIIQIENGEIYYVFLFCVYFDSVMSRVARFATRVDTHSHVLLV